MKGTNGRPRTLRATNVAETTIDGATASSVPLADASKAQPRSSSVAIANGFIYVAAFTSSWTAAAVGAYNLVDYALAGAVLFTVIAWAVKRRRLYISAWMVGPVVAAVIVTGVDVIGGGGSSGQIEDIARIMLSTAIIAVLLTAQATERRPRILFRTLKWWAFGIGVNGLAAILVSFGVIDFTGILIQPTGARLSGLASHPNSIAYSLTLAVPAIVYFIHYGRGLRGRLFWVSVMVGVVWALYLSDSRAGWIVAIPTLAISLALALSRSRLKLLAPALLILGTIAALTNVPRLLQDTRLASGSEQSDSGRTVFNDDALTVFANNPLFGGGFDDQIGVSVPLMVISGGGVILAIAYYLFVLWPLPTLWRGKSTPIAQVGILSLAVFLGFGLLNPVFVERATFWPILIAALVVLLERYTDGNPWLRQEYPASSRRFAGPPSST